MTEVGVVKVARLKNFDILNMEGVQVNGLVEPTAGVNSISPEWQMNPVDDSSTNFLFAMRFAGASRQALAEFVRTVPKKGDWNFKKYSQFVGSGLVTSCSQADQEQALLANVEALLAKTDGALQGAVTEFQAENGGIAPTYGDILVVDVPQDMQDCFPTSWRSIVAALGPDCGCRSKRPFVPAFRTELPGNIEVVSDGKYRYTAPNEDPTRPMSTHASKATLFALFFRLLVRSSTSGHCAVVAPQIGLSVFNHDAAVAQEMIALAVKAYSRLTTIESAALTLYVTTVDKEAKVERITDALEQALVRCGDAGDEEMAAKILSFLPDLRSIPAAHVRLHGESQQSPVFDHDPNEPGAFRYDTPEAKACLDGADCSWGALEQFLTSREFLHFGLKRGSSL